MSDFDPTNFNPGQHSSGEGENLPPGEYMFWVRSFKRKESRGNEQLLMIIEPVLTKKGNEIPKDAFSPIFETLTLSQKAAWRLAELCAAIGQDSPFNAMSDREVAAVFRFKPFKATVKLQTYQGRESSRIDKYLSSTPQEKSLALEVYEARAVDQSVGGGYDEFDPGNSFQSDSPGVSTSNDEDDDLPF